MAAFSLGVVATIRGDLVCNETWELKLGKLCNLQTA